MLPLFSCFSSGLVGRILLVRHKQAAHPLRVGGHLDLCLRWLWLKLGSRNLHAVAQPAAAVAIAFTTTAFSIISRSFATTPSLSYVARPLTSPYAPTPLSTTSVSTAFAPTASVATTTKPSATVTSSTTTATVLTSTALAAATLATALTTTGIATTALAAAPRAWGQDYKCHRHQSWDSLQGGRRRQRLWPVPAGRIQGTAPSALLLLPARVPCLAASDGGECEPGAGNGQHCVRRVSAHRNGGGSRERVFGQRVRSAWRNGGREPGDYYYAGCDGRCRPAWSVTAAALTTAALTATAIAAAVAPTPIPNPFAAAVSAALLATRAACAASLAAAFTPAVSPTASTLAG